MDLLCLLLCVTISRNSDMKFPKEALVVVCMCSKRSRLRPAAQLEERRPFVHPTRLVYT